jgi:hypothetical protein
MGKFSDENQSALKSINQTWGDAPRPRAPHAAVRL